MTATFRPRSFAVDNYPFDLDASERFTRLSSVTAIHPYPTICGMISGILQTFDSVIMSQAIAKTPYGPGTTTIPLNLQYQITIPGLTKIG